MIDMPIDIQNSVVMISSADPTNKNFGTGFVIHQDQGATYVVTCAHVVKKVGGVETVNVEDYSAKVVAVDNGFDVAVLRIDNLLKQTALKTTSTARKGSSFVTAGFYELGKLTVIQAIEGILDEKAGVRSSALKRSVPVWHIKIKDNEYVLQPGYSGAPLVHSATGEVLGVISIGSETGQTGLAVSIEAVKKIWIDSLLGIFEDMKKLDIPQSANGITQYAKAVIFTHFGSLRYFDPGTQDVNQSIEKYAETLERFMACNRDGPLISIIYIYLDWAVQKAILNLSEESGGKLQFAIDFGLIRQENMLKGILIGAERMARLNLGLSPSDPPKVFYIGLNELGAVLDNLVYVEPRMPRFLCGSEGHFTYDSPKFVEAVIRLSRSDIPHLAGHPIIRVDEDAQINPHNIKLLLDQFIKISGQKPLFFFSGNYRRSNGIYDPINDYAVRTHWFFPPNTEPGDKRFADPDDDEFRRGIDLAETFLADLSVLGATQPTKHENSRHLKQLIDEKKLRYPPERSSPQAISGAGLIMARRNIDILPPFMNFEQMTSWIDDHLKRRLHEMLGDMAPMDAESISSAYFQQERDLIPPETYFQRLLRGCLFHSLITDQSGQATEYSKLVREIAWYKRTKLADDEIRKIGEQISKLAQERYDAVMYCWSSPEFQESPYRASFEWAKKCLKNGEHKAKLCDMPPHFKLTEFSFQGLRQEELPDKVPDRIPDEVLKKLRANFFRLTEQSFDALRDENIPNNLLEKLKPLENEEVADEKEFLNAVQKQIGQELTDCYKILILKHALKSLVDKRFDTKEEFLESVKNQIGEEQFIEYKKLILKHAQQGEVVKDALAYLDLMLNWHVFTRAIDRLSFVENQWLFEPVE